jgi:flagellar motor switch protein FliN/FliY
MWKIMSNGFLSQEEIDALLNGGDMGAEPDISPENVASSKPEVDGSLGEKSEPNQPFELSDIEKDLLGEVGNISMGSASTALSTIVGLPVNIATPVVSVSTLKELRAKYIVPNIALDVKFTSGISGGNLLVMKTTDAAVIASLMMGGDGILEGEPVLSEIEISAVSEAMNQMIGSAATSMATMFAREVNISPPESRIWDESTSPLSDSIDEDEQVVQVAFRITIGDLIDSVIMQVLPTQTAK